MLDTVDPSYLTAATHCPRCVAAGHPEHFGSPRGCAFPPTTGGVFSEGNWNCETMSQLRQIAYDAGWALRWNDQSVAVMPFEEWGFLVLSYYKDRGATDKAYWADSGKPITLEEAEDAIRAGVRFVEAYADRDR